jgi:hypothetical protein
MFLRRVIEGDSGNASSAAQVMRLPTKPWTASRARQRRSTLVRIQRSHLPA